MTRLTGFNAPARLTMPVRPQSTVVKQAHSLTDVLADPWGRLAAGTAALLATTLAVRRDRVSPDEARVFRAVNGLPDALYVPAWAIMQLGTLGAAPGCWCGVAGRRP